MVNARVPIEFQWEGAPGQSVLLKGDFPDWKYPISMTEVLPGHYHCALLLLPGLYRYKFHVNLERWVVDPRARLLDHAEGVTNGVLLVGGTTPPLVFAPDHRHVWRTHGAFHLHAEMVAGHRPPPHVWIAHGDLDAQLPLRVVGERHGRILLHASGPIPDEETVHYGFAGDPSHVFSLPPPSPLASSPAWARHAAFYGVFVDRARRAPSSPPDPRAAERTFPSSPNTFYGGDLDGVAADLEAVQALGMDAVVLTPIHVSESPHRYDGVDLTSVDPRLGGEPALKRLIHAAHARGMRLVLDAAITHVHQDHAAFQHLLRHQEASPFASWFRVLRFPVEQGNAATYEHYYGNTALPWLNLASGPARDHVEEALATLVSLGVDGLRLDAMNDAPVDFWIHLRARLRMLNPSLLLLGEVVGDSPSRLGQERGVDVATDFGHRELMLDFFARGRLDAPAFVEALAFLTHRLGPVDPAFPLLFLDNHDTARFMSVARNYDRLRLALGYLFFRPQPLWFTYGTQHPLFGGKPVWDLDDAWPERIALPDVEPPETLTHALVKRLGRLRQQEAALRGTSCDVAAAAGHLLLLQRHHAGRLVRALFNLGDASVSVDKWVPADARTLVAVNHAEGDPRAPLAPLCARWVDCSPSTS